jgi:hypothetical protein
MASRSPEKTSGPMRSSPIFVHLQFPAEGAGRPAWLSRSSSGMDTRPARPPCDPPGHAGRGEIPSRKSSGIVRRLARPPCDPSEHAGPGKIPSRRSSGVVGRLARPPCDPTEHAGRGKIPSRRSSEIPGRLARQPWHPADHPGLPENLPSPPLSPVGPHLGQTRRSQATRSGREIPLPTHTKPTLYGQ